MTFLKKRGCGSPALSVEPPSPAALRRTTGRQTGRRSDAPEEQKATIIEAADAGCAKKIVALPVDFVSRVLRGSDVI